MTFNSAYTEHWKILQEWEQKEVVTVYQDQQGWHSSRVCILCGVLLCSWWLHSWDDSLGRFQYYNSWHCKCHKFPSILVSYHGCQSGRWAPQGLVPCSWSRICNRLPQGFFHHRLLSPPHWSLPRCLPRHPAGRRWAGSRPSSLQPWPASGWRQVDK